MGVGGEEWKGGNSGAGGRVQRSDICEHRLLVFRATAPRWERPTWDFTTHLVVFVKRK